MPKENWPEQASPQDWPLSLGQSLPVLQLPTDRPRPAVRTNRRARLWRNLPPSLLEALKRLSQGEGATLFMTLLGAFQTLLYRYTGQVDVIVGSPVVGHAGLGSWVSQRVRESRDRQANESIDPLACLPVDLHWQAFRTDLSGDPTFRQLLVRMRDVVEAYAHRDLPLIRPAANDQPSATGWPWSVVFAFFESTQAVSGVDDGSTSQRVGGPGGRESERCTETDGLDTARSRSGSSERGSSFSACDSLPQALIDSNGRWAVDVSLFLEATEQGLTAIFDYDADLFDATSISRMAGHFQTLLQGIVACPDERLSRLPLLTEAERQQLLVEWNDTQMEFPHDSCLHQLFEAQVERNPNAVAVISQQESLTYAELNQRANQLAHLLRSLGVGPDVPVGICVERSVAMVVGLMGIAKAGGAYVPLDPSYPRDRLAFMLEDTQVPVLVTQERLLAELPDHQAQVVCLDGLAERPPIPTTTSQTSSETQHSNIWNLEFGNGDFPKEAVTPENLCYIIYTSGSTGRPKGIMLNHQGRVNNFCDFNRRFQIGPGDRLIALSSLSFDMCAYDVFGILAAGAAIVLPEARQEREPLHWAELMVQHRVTVWHSAPAMLEMLVEYVAHQPELHPRFLRLVLLGGDWIPVTLPDRIKALAPGVTVVSMGGATEASMDSTIYVIERTDPTWKSIPYGRPMYNQLAYVLDEQLQPLPIGVPGELHLGGIGLAWGYLNRPDLTAEKFIPNPFSRQPGDRLYKTGDLACYLPDGNLKLLGRMDFQVKIRGYRVELGEIASTLMQHPAVQEATVIAREDGSGNKQLVAYVVPNREWRNERSEEREGEGESSDWAREQIWQWQRVYDETYSQTVTEADPTFNIIGWNSSYTGLPIPPEQMREWVDQTVERILALRSRRVLEIGCGTGLLLFRIAPHCLDYCGIDFSAEALRYIQQQLMTPGRELPQVSLLQRTAENLEGIEAEFFDVVILNSIVQLFPSLDYLFQVLERAAQAVAPGGFMYVGDVISLPHLEMFHTTVQLHQAPAWISRAQLEQRIRKQVMQEEQLFVDPAFFQALPQHLPKISHVQMQLRRGRYHNEMTQFRYDVLLHVSAGQSTSQVSPSLSLSPSSTPQVTWLDWQQQELSLEAVRQYLVQKEPDVLGLARVPNARLRTEVKALEWLARAEGPATVGELREVLRHIPDDAGVHPEDLWAIGDELPYTVHITWSRSGEIGCYDALLARRPTASATADAGWLTERQLDALPRPSSASRKPWSHYANNPLQGLLTRKLVPQLRSFLQEKLPEYMVPSAFVLLEALPLSPNGKVDRRALPVPDQARPELDEPFVAPRNPLEEVVAGVWAEILGVERVGIHDHFLELGGHSLLATQIMSRLQDIFPLELPLRYLFESPTVAQLAERIEAAGQAAQVDVLKAAQILLQLASLSEDEVKNRLKQLNGTVNQ